MKVTQEPIQLFKILENEEFAIPLYQREYSWGLEQVSDLYYDIIETDQEGHFLGSLLLYESAKGKRVEVVDGQQRLTTLSLFLFTILNLLENSEPRKNKAIERIRELLFVEDRNNLFSEKSSGLPRLELGKRDKKLFSSIIQNQNIESHKDGRRTSHKNLTQAVSFFSEQLKEVVKNQGIDGLVKLAENIIRCEFVVMTAEKSSDKLMLFKTINARGLELTQSDMIKNELCHNLKEDHEIDNAITLWDEVKSEIEKNNGNFDNFLFHYINSLSNSQQLRAIKDHKQGKGNTSGFKYPPVSEKLVFDIYELHIKEIGVNEFLEDLKESLEPYIQLINPTNEKIYLQGLKAMGVTKCFPLLLRACKYLNEREFDKISQGIEALTFRHSILRKDPKELERFYYDLSEEINESSDVCALLEKIGAHANFRDNVQFKNEFIVASPKQSVSKMILDRIVRQNSESVDWSNKDTHIEHIMPQTAKFNWLDLYNTDPVEYKDYLNRLGNLTILQDKKNIKAKNKSFVDKKVFYNESRLKITKDLCQYEDWGYAQIDARQEKLFEEVRVIWSFDVQK